MKLTDHLGIYLESKQVGMIYHFTKLPYAVKIFRNELVLLSSKESGFSDSGNNKESDEDNLEYVSFTRNKNLNTTSFFKYHDVRFNINGDILSHKYKIQPFMDWKVTRGHNESEEMIEASNVDITKALVSVTLLS